MNWCQKHWDLLREKIKLKGLDGFGAQTGEEAAAELQAQLETGEEQTFDPLLGCWNRVNTAMAKSLEGQGRGFEILQMRCPCCVLEEDGQPELVENWLEGVTDEAREYAQQQGLLEVS